LLAVLILIFFIAQTNPSKGYIGGRLPSIQRVERQREREGITADRREGEDPKKTTAKNSWALPIKSQNGCKDVNYLEVKTWLKVVVVRKTF
jgi:hypothetical protein